MNHHTTVVEGVNRLSAKMRRDELRAETYRQVAEAVRESITEETGVIKGAAPGDTRKLRGIPLFPKEGGICGTMAGTDPEREAIRRVA